MKSALKLKDADIFSISSENMLEDLRKFKWKNIVDEVERQTPLLASVIAGNYLQL